MLERSRCAVTHPQIASGTCPYCGMTIDRDSIAEGADAGTASMRWNLARMLADLDQEDEDIRLTTILNLSDHLPPLEQALPVIRKALQDRAERVRDRALTASSRLVKTPEDEVIVAVCETLLKHDPADLAALHVLLYFFSRTQCGADSYRGERHALILRVIANMPEVPKSLMVPMKLFPQTDGEVFEQAKTLWLKQVEQHPDNVHVLENASLTGRPIWYWVGSRFHARILPKRGPGFSVRRDAGGSLSWERILLHGPTHEAGSLDARPGPSRSCSRILRARRRARARVSRSVRQMGGRD